MKSTLTQCLGQVVEIETHARFVQTKLDVKGTNYAPYVEELKESTVYPV